MAKKDKHERHNRSSIAEEFKPSKEDKFPRLEEDYWKNPNSGRGKVVICPGAESNYREIHQSPGV